MFSKLIPLFTFFCLLVGQRLYAQSINHTEFRDFWQDFRSGVGGGYGTKILRLSAANLNNVTISNYMAEWRSNRCIWRSFAVSQAEEVEMQANNTLAIFDISTPSKGKATFQFAKNTQGFWRFTSYKKTGNITCPVINENNTNLYARPDVVGTWVNPRLEWLTYPLTPNKTPAEKYAELQNEAKFQMLVEKLVFNNNTLEVHTIQGKPTFQWRFSYNQLHIRETPQQEWKVWNYTWKIDKNGNFNIEWYNYDAGGAESLKWVFTKQ